MNEQFSRTAMLLGEEGINKLSDSKVLVFGVGGVGGFVVEGLARAGVGHIDIVDNDSVCLSNLNRQIIALHSTVGMDKADVCRNRIKDINPECEVNVFKCFYLPETADQFDFAAYDYVIDAIDTVTAKIDIIVKCTEAGIPVLSSMGTGNKLDPTQIEVTDIYKTEMDPLAKVMRRELKKRGVRKLKVVYSGEKALKPDYSFDSEKEETLADNEQSGSTGRKKLPPGSVSFVPSVAGLVIASEVIKDILGIKK
ncbi:tRNA threonylcarbamoyladenosine dehydratase [Butyrivibrio sp. DSM 10294]|uniref:tRNA threonylcarbamoyladenosine dehydratase n=1 Tax=Butyrivibrio sp. DSM 10294 TaxID=2972457 RepID=UPI00234E5AED|nr:tRNA threonylcarbamoyladenosine dehydratase [Butyrivibrio sp. DSM 10294]MDC7293993.1 tRNA threonylcarbamoyladenosine dehydratase [Butyrivibrio sp. DSM 10294]